ncbi:MAG: Kelch repeat-containing protein [Bdellovibrionales bacterium]
MRMLSRGFVVLMLSVSIFSFQNCGHFKAATSRANYSSSFDPTMSGSELSLKADIQDVSLLPGENAVVTIVLDHVPTSDFNFTFSTSDNTAIAGTHYTAVMNGNAVISANSLSTQVTIQTSNTLGMSYLGKSFSLNFTFPNYPALNHSAKISFSAAPKAPATQTNLKNMWTPLSVTNSTPTARFSHSAVWTGSRMIIWGGIILGGPTNSGGVYDPVTDTWAPLVQSGAMPAARSNHVAVWTGSQMIVWGGSDYTKMIVRQPTPCPSFQDCSVTDTGYDYGDGGLYDPVTGVWTAIPSTGAPSARADASAVWTGTAMLVWGGNDYSQNQFIAGPLQNTCVGTLKIPAATNGKAFNPKTGIWTPISSANGANGFSGSAVWNGKNLLFLNGISLITDPYIWDCFSNVNTPNYQRVANRVGYDPATDSWNLTMTAAGAPSLRNHHTSVWTGTSMIVWGGFTDPNTRVNDGAVYY